MNVPNTIAEYFLAANTDDADRVAACFAENAVVRDEGGEIHGKSAVRRWAENTRRKYRYRVEVVKAEQEADRIIVTAHLSGDFPGSPIDLRYRFKLAGATIIALEIG